MKPSKEALIPADAIAARVRELGEQLSADFGKAEVVVVAVLKGGLIFASDLVRAMRIPVTLDFMRPKSYAGTASRNRVDILVAPTEILTNKTVLVVEDILDTGRTTAVLLDWIAQRRPAAVRVVTLLNKQARRVNDVRADYVGFEIDDHFVVGYGLDYNERYRELPGVHTLNGVSE